MKWADYLDMWFNDKQSMLETMIKNMQDDLKAGYSYSGKIIQEQREAIKQYEEKFDEQMKSFCMMDHDQVGRWCYYDMKCRGAIA